MSLRLAKREELEIFDKLDRQEHARRFINETGLKVHQSNFDDQKITYLCIENPQDVFCGYIILVKQVDTASIEFRRILIDQKQRGIGQVAISEMEIYCRKDMGVRLIWLDVYDDNELGIHVYEKLGYRRFKEEPVGERRLLFYKKTL